MSIRTELVNSIKAAAVFGASRYNDNTFKTYNSALDVVGKLNSPDDRITYAILPTKDKKYDVLDGNKNILKTFDDADSASAFARQHKFASDAGRIKNMQIKQAMAADISLAAMTKMAMLSKAAGDNDTYYCDTCGWQGKGSSLVNGKCPKCGKSVRLIKSAAADLIPGGRGDNAKPSQFDQNELSQGMKVEKEHTDSKELAKQIAIDHLTEFPDYYTRLDKMESEAKKAKQAAEAMVDAEQGSDNISESQKQQIIDYIKQTARPKDEDMHELFAKLNINPHRAEDVIYEFAHSLASDKTAAAGLGKITKNLSALMNRGQSGKAVDMAKTVMQAQTPTQAMLAEAAKKKQAILDAAKAASKPEFVPVRRQAWQPDNNAQFYSNQGYTRR